MAQLVLEGLRQELDEMVPRVQQVMKQARARIYRGDTHAEGKIVSLFEPSTEVIRKGKAAKPNEFGKMIKLQEALAGPRKRGPPHRPAFYLRQ